ncbi:hypothetical protein PCAU_0180 [Pseudomonas chlororaphis subsp. aurantiaca]|uniref:hypothetical protein n=1 Tax=Pseudomonas chlororaphis TaxID=587753 RepID=UPI0008650754|nr:hypothetical protein [Pseudomonas chlororaphis]BAV72389.1 hypothetical protein PCAU_0180 [Pseudomonas chlororaphis subsp. aurantiaca]
MMHSDHPRSSSRLRHARLALLVSAFTTAGSSLPIVAMAADDDSWQFNGGPYLWGAGIRGHVGHRSTGTQFIKSDFSDIARTVDMSVMLMGEARRGPYSVLADLMYIDTDTRNRLPAGAPASKLEVESKTASGFLGGGYTVLGDDNHRLDVAGGVRVWYSSTAITLHGGPAGGLSGSDKATWADAMVGLRGHYAVNDRFWLSSWGMVGAGQSREDWDLAALAGWEFLPGFSAVAGYRAMGVNYRHDGFVYDIVQKGPLLGISGRF